MGQQLSAKCHKAAIQNPCKTKAFAHAADKCKGNTGMAYGRCMDSIYESALVTYCADVVCPGDPFAIKVSAASTGSKTTQEGAEGGGGFTGRQSEYAVSQEFKSEGGEEGGGLDPTKLRLYLGAGIGVIVVLAILRRRK